MIASALQEGVVTRDTTFNCENGLWKSRYITIRDDSRPKQNIQSVAKILANSSNIGCGKSGWSSARSSTSVTFPGLASANARASSSPRARGILRRRANGAQADLISSSFGQSLSVTVLQMAQAYLTLANEGVYKPLRIVLTDDVGGGDQRIFSKNTTREVLSMMREVVDEGTGKRAAIPGVSVAGKTGTAQKAFRGKYGGERTASFVGLVPAEKPQYLVVIFIDEPSKVKYGGVIAAPVFKSVTSRVMAYHGSLPDPGALTPAQIKAQEKAEAGPAPCGAAGEQGKDRAWRVPQRVGDEEDGVAGSGFGNGPGRGGAVRAAGCGNVCPAGACPCHQGQWFKSGTTNAGTGRALGGEGFGPHVMRSLAFGAGIMGMYPLSLLESRVAAQGMELCIDSRKATPGCVFVALPAAVLMVLSSLPTPWRGGLGTWSVALNPPGTAAKRKSSTVPIPGRPLGCWPAPVRHGLSPVPRGRRDRDQRQDHHDLSARSSVRLRREEDRRARYGFLSLAGAS